MASAEKSRQQKIHRVGHTKPHQYHFRTRMFSFSNTRTRKRMAANWTMRLKLSQTKSMCSGNVQALSHHTNTSISNKSTLDQRHAYPVSLLPPTVVPCRDPSVSTSCTTSSRTERTHNPAHQGSPCFPRRHHHRHRLEGPCEGFQSTAVGSRSSKANCRWQSAAPVVTPPRACPTRRHKLQVGVVQLEAQVFPRQDTEVDQRYQRAARIPSTCLSAQCSVFLGCGQHVWIRLSAGAEPCQDRQFHRNISGLALHMNKLCAKIAACASI